MDIAAVLRASESLEKRGDIASAMAGYQKVLRRQPSNIDALFLLGQAYCHQGQLEAGSKLFRKIVTLRPNHAPAHTLLGMALAQLGSPEEALVFLEKALLADNNFAMAFGVRADILAALGRDREATENFERALELKPDIAEVHYNFASVLQRLARYEDAIRHYRTALKLRPDLTRVYGNLGRALFSLGRWQEALESVQRGITFEPTSVQLHHAMGLILKELERYQESLLSFEKALALDPNDLASMANKGTLLQILGRLDDARAVIKQVIAREPNNSAYYFKLSTITQFKDGDPHIAAMERLLLPGTESRPEEDQINLHFALAKAYRDIGKPAQSFRHLVQGNALRRHHIDYVENAVIDRIDRICQVFTPELMKAKAGQGSPSHKPIFIIGMPRSGTTLLEQILGSHPQVTPLGERDAFEKAVLTLTSPGAAEYPDFIANVTPKQVGAIGAAYLESMCALAPVADRFIDKLPSNYMYAGLIHLALPHARIIHSRRDPIDTCISCFSTSFSRAQPFAFELAELGRYYRAYERLMDHWRRVLPPSSMLEVQYEDVVNDIEGQARRIVAYCGLEWDQTCLAFHKLERAVLTASVAQVRQPIYRSSIGRWREYAEQLGPLLAALGLSAQTP
jgi:tetratricopeptide (TPR) repeat protein